MEQKPRIKYAYDMEQEKKIYAKFKRFWIIIMREQEQDSARKWTEERKRKHETRPIE